MTFVATVVRVLIASPSDLREERDRVVEIVHRWNALHAAHIGVVLLPVRWETNASAEMGAPSQDVINRQIVDDSDVLVGFFWTRLGTPTANHLSGTAEELQRFLDASKPASLFVSRRPTDPHLIDQEQFAALRSFLDTQRANGLVPEFQTAEDLATQVEQSLTRVIREKFADQQPPAVLTQAPPTADVRAHHIGSGSNHHVVIENFGEGEARDVTIETDGGGADQTGWNLIGSDQSIDYLLAGATFRFLAAIHFGSPPRVTCTLRWINPDDSEGTSRQTLSMF